MDFLRSFRSNLGPRIADHLQRLPQSPTVCQTVVFVSKPCAFDVCFLLFGAKPSQLAQRMWDLRVNF